MSRPKTITGLISGLICLGIFAYVLTDQQFVQSMIKWICDSVNSH